MTTANALTDHFYQQLHAPLQELEDERLQLLRTIAKIRKVLLITGVVLMVSVVGFFVGLPLLFTAFLVKYPMSRIYVFKFKERVVRLLIRNIDTSLQYIQHEAIHPVFLTRSRLFPSFKPSPDALAGNDSVRGTIKGVKVQFSDVTIRHRFRGVFMVAEFNKAFKSTVIVVPDRMEKAFGAMVGRSLQGNSGVHGSLMQMDSPAFEKEFSVYGSDPIETRYLLTHAMMERLLAFQKSSRAPLSLSFVEGHLYMAVATGKDLFEPSVTTSVFDYAQIREYIETLLLFTGVVEELKLNEKLWSKP